MNLNTMRLITWQRAALLIEDIHLVCKCHRGRAGAEFLNTTHGKKSSKWTKVQTFFLQNTMFLTCFFFKNEMLEQNLHDFFCTYRGLYALTMAFVGFFYSISSMLRVWITPCRKSSQKDILGLGFCHVAFILCILIRYCNTYIDWWNQNVQLQ